MDQDLGWVRAMLHPTKNFRRALNGSVRYFKCLRGADHEFAARPMDLVARGRSRACPCCAHEQVSQTNSVASLHPSVAAEWHPTKNAAHVPSPAQTLSSARAAVWFRCSTDARHEWRAVVANRCAGEPCPFCSGAVAPAYTTLYVRLGRDVVDYFWADRVKPDNVLSGSDVAVELRDPLTGTRWSTTPSDLCDVAETSTFDNAIEAVYSRFVDRRARSKALGLLKAALGVVESFVVDVLVHEALELETGVSMPLGDYLADVAPSPPEQTSPPTPPRKYRNPRAVFLGGRPKPSPRQIPSPTRQLPPRNTPPAEHPTTVEGDTPPQEHHPGAGAESLQSGATQAKASSSRTSSKTCTVL